ncbi:MAG TPA: hypothetical protein VHN15_12065, partial [Thermoanaerobaculia bacterium]|nr:hypothetical protein [Thermoanaerobaculia bacterium]
MTGRSSFPAALLALALAAGPAALPACAASAAVDPALLSGLRARSIGPAAMSGRVADVESVASNPGLIYVGSANGGIWKSTNGGVTWQPVFDDQKVASIGDLAVEAGNPDVVWAGTGEANVRNSVSVGWGVYRTTDGGRTWKHLGLEKTERISRVLLHPGNPRVAYVAAMGQAWGENPERGVYRTEDGGQTWKRVLYVDERTGAAELVMDPSNPNRLIAAMWDYRRQPWTFRSGGPGSGLFLSTDGGDSWRKLTEEDGLPQGDLGRTGLAFAPSDPRVVYALVEAQSNALLRSDDGGRTWRTVNSDTHVSPRPFYYADLRVDPENPNRVYRLGSLVHVSNDGGRTFQVLISFSDAHPDHHALWIDPRDGRYMINGNDGGVAISRDRGESWQYVSNLPLSQFYHVRFDNAVPYNIYGGLQDNGSWKAPSTVWDNGGIRNQHWQEVMFGDGFDTVPDPRDPMAGYAMSQTGYLVRYDLRTGERKDIRPISPNPDEELRFNWNAGIAIDPFEPDTLYFGSQYVHKTTDRGQSWTVISPDLTTDRAEWQQEETGGLTPDVTGAEAYTTILAIAPSPRQRGVLWVGTDDGRLHVTRDGGKTWDSVEKNLRGVPANTWIPHIHPSDHDAGTAFVVLDDHRRSNWTPYVYRTTDYGKTWTSLATSDLWGYALAIVQDPVDPDLLFLGTEFGLYASLDGGKRWMPFKHGIPTTSVMDLAIHPREHDLIVATHGRGVYIVDDIRPLRSVSDDTQKKAVHLFELADAQQYRVGQTGGSRFPGDTEFRGTPRPYGAAITYSLNAAGLPHPDREKERELKESERVRQRREKEKTAAAAASGKPAAPATEGESRGEELAAEAPAAGRRGPTGPQADIEILDGSGKVIRTFQQPAVQGVNRAVWDLRRNPFKQPGADDELAAFFGGGGPEVLPGTYTVRVKYGKEQAEGKVRVVADPRFPEDTAGRQARYDAVLRAGALQEAMANAVERLTRTRTDVNAVLARLQAQETEDKRLGVTEENKTRKDLMAAARKLLQGMDKVERQLWDPPTTKGITADTELQWKITFVSGSLSSAWDAPTEAQRTNLQRAEEATRKSLDEV